MLRSTFSLFLGEEMDGNVVSDGLTGFFLRGSTVLVPHDKPIVELYDELRPSLFGYLVCLGLMPQEADDIIQDAFVQLFRVLLSGSRIHNPRSWVFRVARNMSLNLQKRERRMVSVSDEQPMARLIGKQTAVGPEEIYLRKERLRVLAAAVARLPQRQRECLHLRAEGLRYREIAEVLGVTTSAVSESLKRVIIRLTDDLYV